MWAYESVFYQIYSLREKAIQHSMSALISLNLVNWQNGLQSQQKSK
ncbi:MAG: hypothetical protein HDT30_04395 [Clostridiales bacterium]|nr:hypothetical protein [Clostridiales bacterium]